MDDQTCFVMMPIRSGKERDYWFDILHSIIKPAVKAADSSIKIERVDEVPGTGNWLERIVKYTANSKYVIADLTGMNPNVVWELGLRHGSNSKGTIIVTQDFGEFKKNMSDLLSYDVHTYNADGSDLSDFKNKIKGSIQRINDDQAHIDSPYFNFIDTTIAKSNSVDVKLIVDDYENDSSHYIEELVFDTSQFTEDPIEITVEDIIKDNLIEDDIENYVSENEVNEYNNQLKSLAEAHLESIKLQWLSKRRRALATYIGLKVVNKSDHLIESVKIELAVSDGLQFLEELPEEMDVEPLPKRPKTVFEASMKSLNNFKNFSRSLGIATSTPFNLPTISTHSLHHNPSRKGIWIYNDTDRNSWAEAKEIMQHDQETRWEKILIVPDCDFQEGSISVEVRAKGMRGIFKKEFPVKIV